MFQLVLLKSLQTHIYRSMNFE